MIMEREKLGSRLGFILLSAGCAIGCGNVWKFPWMCGQYGGGGFVLLYILCLVILGLPIMIMEFSVGRAAQASPIRMYQRLEKKGQKWHIHGYVSFFGSVALMAFYTVVTGWIVYYFVQFLTGHSRELGFAAMITDPGVNVTYLAVTVVLAFGILCFGLQSGLERVTKYMMMLLLVLMLVLAVCEEILAMVRDLTGWSRPVGCLVCGGGIFLVALTTALGYSVLHFQPFAEGTAWLDLWDFLVSNNILPLGSLVLALFCCNRFGWGWDNFLLEANAGQGLKVRPWMKPLFRYVVPAAILFIYVYGMATFQWK